MDEAPTRMLSDLPLGVPRGFDEFVGLLDVGCLGGKDLAYGQGHVGVRGFVVGLEGLIFSFFGCGEQA